MYMFKVKDKDSKANFLDVVLVNLFLTLNSFSTFNLVNLWLAISTYLLAWSFAQYVLSIIDNLVDLLYRNINILPKPRHRSYIIQSIAFGNSRH